MNLIVWQYKYKFNITSSHFIEVKLKKWKSLRRENFLLFKIFIRQLLYCCPVNAQHCSSHVFHTDEKFKTWKMRGKASNDLSLESSNAVEEFNLSINFVFSLSLFHLCRFKFRWKLNVVGFGGMCGEDSKPTSGGKLAKLSRVCLGFRASIATMLCRLAIGKVSSSLKWSEQRGHWELMEKSEERKENK